LLVGNHGRSRSGFGPVRGAAFGALRQREHEYGAEVPGQEAQYLAAGGSSLRHSGVFSEELEPVCLVSSLCLGQGEQDLAFFAVATLGELPVDSGFGTLVSQVLTPPPDVRGRGPA
jgi:hypothetical protein